VWSAAIYVAQGGSDNDDPWLVVGVALIAATAALLGAVIAARTAAARQKQQHAHDERRLKDQLAAEAERLAEQLANDRTLRDLDEMRRQLSSAMAKATQLVNPVTRVHSLKWKDGQSTSNEKDALSSITQNVRESLADLRRDTLALLLLIGNDEDVVGKFRATFAAIERVIDAKNAAEGDKGQDDYSTAMAELIAAAHRLVGVQRVSPTERE
jgi:hypothetical protein